jgi:hypothetical protein
MNANPLFSQNASANVADPIVGKILKIIPKSTRGVVLHDPNAHFLHDWDLTAAQLDHLFGAVEHAFNVKTPELFSEAVDSVQHLADYVRARA